MTTPTRLVADGGYTALDITTATNLVGGGSGPNNPNSGTVYRVIVQATAAAISYILDSASATQTSANTILPIPVSTPVGTIYTLNWPFFQGLSVVPGSGVTLAVSYSVGNQG
jgi:hypothetical protein